MTAIAVSSLVFAVVVAYALRKNVRLGSPAIALTIVTGLLFLSLFVSGASSDSGLRRAAGFSSTTDKDVKPRSYY
jgi:hypothetical protein